MPKPKNKRPSSHIPADNPQTQDKAPSRVDRTVTPSYRVEQAVAALLRFWRLGRDSLDKDLLGSRGPNTRKATEAERLGIGREWLRKARRFATQCSLAELETCIAAARRRGYAIYPSTLLAV